MRLTKQWETVSLSEIEFQSPCGEEVSATVWDWLAIADIEHNMFQSPCGEEVSATPPFETLTL